jgi:hypothetical protein
VGRMPSGRETWGTGESRVVLSAFKKKTPPCLSKNRRDQGRTPLVSEERKERLGDPLTSILWSEPTANTVRTVLIFGWHVA